MLQEEIRTWVADVIMDALKQGFSQNLLFEPEDPQSGLLLSPGTPSTHLERFLYAMLLHADMPPRATRAYVYRDSNEQIFNILQVVLACVSPQSFVWKICFILLPNDWRQALTDAYHTHS